jgi:FAD dependent oxidoreductase
MQAWLEGRMPCWSQALSSRSPPRPICTGSGAGRIAGNRPAPAALARVTDEAAVTIYEPARAVDVAHRVPVLVVGGGPGGLAAAIAAARAGAELSLLERFGCFGGNLTVVGVEGPEDSGSQRPGTRSGGAGSAASRYVSLGSAHPRTACAVCAPRHSRARGGAKGLSCGPGSDLAPWLTRKRSQTPGAAWAAGGC